MGSKLALFKLFGQKVMYQAGAIHKANKKFLVPISADKIGVKTTFLEGNSFIEKNKMQKMLFNTVGKGVLLSKTEGFYPAMTLMGLVSGGIGYLLSGLGDDDSDQNQGLVIEKEENSKSKDGTNNPSDKVIVTQEVKNDYHTIKTGGATWKSIVETYYPELVEKCNGNLYGGNGAIRVLKNALSKCDNIDLINSTDIPYTLNLPLEPDGVKINSKAVLSKGKIEDLGGHTDIKEAGCKNQKTEYTATDPIRNKSYSHADKDAAVDSLKNRTGIKEYQIQN